MPSFLSSLSDKAQSAINASPLAHRLPANMRPASPDQPSANDAATQGGHKSHALEAIQHQLRTLGQQYSSSTSAVQKIITTEKGVAIDFDSLSRDSKAQSKELYTWGQGEDADLKDVSDRLAYLNFVQGSLAASLALKLDAARAPFKSLRDAETALAPRRNVRSALRTQLARLEHDNQKGMEKKIAEVKEQLRKAEADDASQEKEVELLKRKAIRESERLKWEALREYGEKVVLLSQASTPILQALPTLPPSSVSPYAGAEATGAARAALQRALDNYKTGHINLHTHPIETDLSRSDTRSFGESHASELSSINSDLTPSSFEPSIPLTPPVTNKPLDPPHVSDAEDKPSSSDVQSTPINPSHLNLSPTPIPHAGEEKPISTTSVATNMAPTVAETGVPLSASESGPGPASGSLRDVRNDNWPSAEEEKRRLQGYSNVFSGGQTFERGSAGQASAEEEKKRLEREERERVLRQGRSNTSETNTDGKKGDEEQLPAYQEF